jgi:hypothetical protein
VYINTNTSAESGPCSLVEGSNCCCKCFKEEIYVYVCMLSSLISHYIVLLTQCITSFLFFLLTLHLQPDLIVNEPNSAEDIRTEPVTSELCFRPSHAPEMNKIMKTDVLNGK